MNEKKRGGIRSLLFKEVEEQAAAPSSPGFSGISPTGSTYSISANTTAVDQDIYAQLFEVLTKNNMDGYDYFEFRSAVENMKAMIPGEAERFKAAFAAVASMTSAEKLVASIEFYCGKLEEKKSEFDQSVAATLKQRVTGKEEQAKKLDADIATTNQQITQLQASISKLQEERTKALNEAMVEKTKIESVQSRFVTTYNKLLSDIRNDQTKIKTYLTKGV